MLIEVVPMLVVEGDVTNRDRLIDVDASVFIKGSVLDGTHVKSAADVYIQGNVVEAKVTSGGSICIKGMAYGSAHRSCILQAGADVAVDEVRVARIAAGADVRLQSKACQCRLHVKGNLYLGGTIHGCLDDCELDVGGGILPLLGDGVQSVEAFERQEERQQCRLTALVTFRLVAPVEFVPATILDISVDGAKCAFGNPEIAAIPGTRIELKFALPAGIGQVILVARIVSRAELGVIEVMFEQIMQSDRDRLRRYCKALQRQRPQARSQSAEQPGADPFADEYR
jgi:hypothetical protein